MTEFRRYCDVAVGDVFPARPLAFDVSQAAVDAFLAATDNDDPAYRTPRPDGTRQAPSMLASVYLVELLKTRGSPPGGIHAKQSITFHRALAVGESLMLQAEVTEKYIRKDRPYVVSQFRACAGDGGLVASGRITTIWGADP